MKYLDPVTDEILTEEDMHELYEEFAYWQEFNGIPKANYEDWLAYQILENDYTEVEEG